MAEQQQRDPVYEARLQIIEQGRWETIGECLDTPEEIEEELAHEEYSGLFVWIASRFGRRAHGRVQ